MIEALGWIATVLGSSIALLIAWAWRWLRQTNRDNDPVDQSVWAGRALHLRDGLPPRVAEVGLLDLGVKPAMDTDSDTDLPPFVARDEDENLEWAITQGGMVLLHGRAAAGKSRTGIEAIRRLRPNDALIAPADGSTLRELAENGADFTNAVVWLDDLERFLTPGGLDQGLLHRLCPEGSNGAVIATMRDEELAHYDHASTSSLGEAPGVTRNAVELIEQLRHRRRVHLKERLSEGERSRAAEQPDHRIQSALRAEEGFGEYLAAGRAMLGRWSTGGGDLFHVGHAIISAAVDCRRAGYHQPLPVSTLENLHAQYLAPGWRHRADLPHVSEGIRWACRRVLGASSCLQPRANNTYLAADYLLDSTETADTPLTGTTVPTPTWQAVLSHANPEQAIVISHAAKIANNDSVELAACRQAADAGLPIGMCALGFLLLDRGEWAQAEVWLRRAANARHPIGMSTLGALLFGRGEDAEAEEWYRKAAEAGYELAMARLGHLLAKRGEDAEAEEWYRKAAEAEDALAMEGLGDLLVKRGEDAEAEEWYRKAAEAGYELAMARLGHLLVKRGEETEAEEWYRKGAEAGYAPAMEGLGHLLAKRGEDAEAEEWHRKAAEAGYAPAMARLGHLLAKRGEETEAEEWHRKGAEAGDKKARLYLSLMLWQRGEDAEAEEWLRSDAETGYEPAMVALALLHSEHEEDAEAEEWHRKGVEAGYAPSMWGLGVLLGKRGEEAEAESWYRKAAEGGYTPATVALASLLANRGEDAEAEEWLRKGAEAGDDNAIQALDDLLSNRERTL